MHAGTRVLRLKRDPSSGDTPWKFEVLAKFEEHESMNYGSDAQLGQQQHGHGQQLKTIVSTSFYDKRLCLWRCDIGSA
jgi:diphthine methyl ester acylhydrolase